MTVSLQHSLRRLRQRSFRWHPGIALDAMILDFHARLLNALLVRLRQRKASDYDSRVALFRTFANFSKPAENAPT
jgi:hypothetical protein